MRGVIFSISILLAIAAYGQTVSGQITDGHSPLSGVLVFVEGSSLSDLTDKEGKFSIILPSVGPVKLVTYYPNYQTELIEVNSERNSEIKLILKQLETLLEEVLIEDESEQHERVGWLNAVSGVGIYEAKKTELIRPDLMTINKAANVSRQIYARVPGLNIWESDGAGVQLGIGGRGLNPNRTSNFNVRQNGYDISADALGYPESYYTPPIQAVDRIELIRGAASLQYGTQFGGMLNFVFRDAPSDQPIAVESIQTVGSFGLFNSFNSVGGTAGKISYYGYYQHKHSDGWRPNSELNLQSGFLALTYHFNALSSLKIEQTHMSYLAQQPGGLMDVEFAKNPRQSKRTRNWFDVNWNITAMTLDHRFSPKLKLNNRTFFLHAHRYAVGNLGRIDRPDDLTANRDLLKDDFLNFGNELRLLYHYQLGSKNAIMVAGSRIYTGLTWRRQGETDASSDPVFEYNKENPLMDSDFDLPSRNAAVFVENILHLTDRLSITPGLRWEYIRTQADGYYIDRSTDLAGNILSEERVEEDKTKERYLMLGGVGVSFKPSEQLEVYGNFSQNFRAINFNDIRVVNPSFQVDPEIDDERGFNVDLGIRGNRLKGLKYDASLFYLSYRDRIGSVLRTEPDPRYNYLIDRTFRYRTNIANAGIVGIESYVEAPLLPKVPDNTSRPELSGFVNFAYIYGKYLNSDENGITGNWVEMVPPVNVKVGLNAKYKGIGASFLFGYVAAHYSDASNADSSPPVPTAVEGLIPSYHFMDLSLDYKYKHWVFEAGSNNLTNQYFFTRRAAGYPGPGILPSDGRSFYLSIGIKM